MTGWRQPSCLVSLTLCPDWTILTLLSHLNASQCSMSLLKRKHCCIWAIVCLWKQLMTCTCMSNQITLTVSSDVVFCRHFDRGINDWLCKWAINYLHLWPWTTKLVIVWLSWSNILFIYWHKSIIMIHTMHFCY